MNTISSDSLSLRQLKAVLQAAETGSISRASAQLSRSQSATSKAISQIERQLGVKLFDRMTAGLIPTSYGEVLVSRLKVAYGEFERAGVAYENLREDPSPVRQLPLFRMEISNQRLVAFLAVHRYRNVRRAADHLGITSHAVYRSLNELQDQLNLPLFERATGGMLEATPYSQILRTHVRLAFSEIQHAIDEMAGMYEGVVLGRVAVATLPAMRNLVVPRAVNRLLESCPKIRVSMREGNFDFLVSALRSGDIDFVIGARNTSLDHPDLDLQYVMDAETRILARVGHPLQEFGNVTAEHLANAKWVLPMKGTTVADWFESYFESRGLSRPRDYVEASSSQITDGILLESDRLALSSAYDVQRRSEHAPIAVLAAHDIEQYSRDNLVKLNIIRRAQTMLSPPAKLFFEELMGVVRDLERSDQQGPRSRNRRSGFVRRIK